MALSNTLSQAFSAGLNFVKKSISYLNMPSLSGVRLECYEYEEVLRSKISENMIISSERGKSVINDNIAPIPRSWNIGAYISSATIGVTLNIEASNSPDSLFRFTGSVNSSNPLNKIAGLDPIPLPGLEPSVFFMPSLNQQREILINAWKNFKLLWFVDKYKNYIPVAIESISFISDPTVQNKIPVRLTIKEIVFYNGSSVKKAVLTTSINKAGSDYTVSWEYITPPDITNPASSAIPLSLASAVPVKDITSTLSSNTFNQSGFIGGL